MVCGVILAAGQSSRMGQSKALLPIGTSGDCFLTRVARTLRDGGADEVVAVVAEETPSIQEAATAMDPPLRLLVNREPERGQLSSLLTALEAVDRPGVRAVMAVPVDVPLVSAATVRALIDAWQQRRGAIVRPAGAGTHGHPVLFDRAVFDALRHADPGAGARAVVRANPDLVADVPVGDPGAFIDIDTPGDYERHIGGLK